MKIILDIPAKTIPQEIVQFRFNPGSKLVEVVVLDGDKNISRHVDITDMWDASTDQQRTIFMGLFKKVGTLAFNKHNEENGKIVEDSDIEDDIF